MRRRGAGWGLLLASATLLALAPTASAGELRKGFEETTVFDGLDYPTAVSFAPKGRVFIAEKSGVVKTYSHLGDEQPSVFADLRTEVHNFHDRGLLGMTIDPRFPKRPYLYVLYARDAPLGGAAPTWGRPNTDSDDCPDPPGTDDGCVISGRLARLTANGGRVKQTKVLVDDWCQQYGTHSVGDLVFGASGALYASAGEGARASLEDFGQSGEPPNPCGDPPAGVGGQQSPPTAEGGSLRSQDLRTAGDPAGLNGSVIRIDPQTGVAMSDNPQASNPDPNVRRIIAYGFRNPFRLAVRPGTDEVWVGDVGDVGFEEIDRLAGAVSNHGWPCYEGTSIQPAWDELDLDLCEGLYREERLTGEAVAEPWYMYPRAGPTVEGDGCAFRGHSAISAIAFAPSRYFPPALDGALFFGDYTRQCIWVLKRGPDGLPDPARARPFLVGDATPVDLEPGPGGLYYLDIFNGELRRIRYFGANGPPEAFLGASRTHGPLPMRVRFSASKSRDPEGKRLRFRWDLDGDGRFDDSRARRPKRVYTHRRPLTVSLRVRDRRGNRDSQRLRVFPGDTPPSLVVRRPVERARWRAQEPIRFAGLARDREDGLLPARALEWELLLRHCRYEQGCHTHPIQELAGTRAGSFVAPEHELPSHLRLLVTATDSDGLAVTRNIRLRPRTVEVRLDSQPGGLVLGLNDELGPTPFSRRVIAGSPFSLSAPSPQELDGVTYEWVSWSDRGARSHETVTQDDVTFGATFEPGL